MHPQVDKKALHEFTQAVRANDLTAQMRIISEQIERSEGAEKVFWLLRRADCRVLMEKLGEVPSRLKEDLDEATRTLPTDLVALLATYLSRAARLQQVAPLFEIPRDLRVRMRTEGYCHQYFFSAWMGNFHWLRRRWYQSFRAFSRAIEQLAAMPDELRRHYEGWNYVYYCRRVCAALRCGRPDQVDEDLRKAEAMTTNRTHLHPWYLAIAKGEVALDRGDYSEALGAVTTLLAHLTDVPTRRLSDTQQWELELLAARIARAQGNRVAFEGFCEKALTLCLEKRLPMSEAHVRAILQGEPY